MRWGDQVLHVARKDLRQQRWLVLGFVAYIASDVALGLSGRLTSPIYNFAALGLIFFASLIVASVVQADSPAEEQSHWATLPLDRGAVFAAKALVALLLVVGVPMIGQALLVIPFGYGVPGVGRMLIRSAGWILFLTAVSLGIASYFRTLAGYYLALLGALVLWVAYGMAVPATARGGSDLAAAVLVLAGVAVSAHLYVARDRRRARWGAAGAIAVALIAGVGASRLDDASGAAEIGDVWAGEVAREVQPKIRLHDVERMSPLDRGQMVRYSVSVRGLAPGWVYRFVPVSGSVIDGGTVEPVGFRSTGSRLHRAPVLPEAEGYTWLSGSWPEETWIEGEQLAPLDEPDGSAAGGVLEVDTYVARRSYAILLPLERSAAAQTEGLTLRIDTLDHGGGTPRVVVSARSWRDPWRLDGQDRAGLSDRPLVFALLNRGTREAVLLEPTVTGGSACCFILPGGVGFDRRVVLSPPTPALSSPVARIDDRWLAEAVLLVAVHEPSGRFRQRVEVGRDPERETAERSR